jgi:hypothetical protein
MPSTNQRRVRAGTGMVINFGLAKKEFSGPFQIQKQSEDYSGTDDKAANARVIGQMVRGAQGFRL